MVFPLIVGMVVQYDVYTQSEIHNLMQHQIDYESNENGVVSSYTIFWISIHFFVDVIVATMFTLGSALNAFSKFGRDTFTHTIIQPNAMVVKMRGASIALSAVFGILEYMGVAFVAIIAIIVVRKWNRRPHSTQALFPDGRICGVPSRRS